MKRDFDLIRRMLLDIETLAPGKKVGIPRYAEVDRETVLEHAILLHEAALIKATVLSPTNAPASLNIYGLTSAGHDFISAAKNDTIWRKAKTSILAPAAGATFSAILEWLKVEALKAAGIS